MLKKRGYLALGISFEVKTKVIVQLGEQSKQSTTRIDSRGKTQKKSIEGENGCLIGLHASRPWTTGMCRKTQPTRRSLLGMSAAQVDQCLHHFDKWMEE